ncbi:ribosomal protein S18-alanine N-acetyltransferase [Planktotalea sp.]|uniref:ribosomal protein S18-alanine N-acetyltransferase n=1 Tax=Planktotalea sp. TaxID=2029877 RepID=UPI00329A228A
MTPHELAALHTRASTSPWSVQSFENQLAQAGTLLSCSQNAFAIGHAVLDEAELLQIATAPEFQNQGLGRKMLHSFEHAAKARGCMRAFLEVAESNTPARALYSGAGWKIDGTRKGYYKHPDGTREDAILMSKSL